MDEDGGALAGGRFERDVASEQLGALMHAEQADASGNLAPGQRRFDADPVILDDESNVVGGARQDYADVAGARMLEHVVEGFAGDAVEGRLDGKRQAFAFGAHFSA